MTLSSTTCTSKYTYALVQYKPCRGVNGEKGVVYHSTGKETVVPKVGINGGVSRSKCEVQESRNFDERYHVLDLPEIPKDTCVDHIRYPARQGRVTSSHQSPRYCIVDSPAGSVRHNRSQINVIPSANTSSDQ